MTNDLAVKQVTIDVINDALGRMTEQHREIGKIPTPKGLVRKIQGFDYVDLTYMKKIANEQFPGWSWTIVNSYALGTEAYVVHGRLKWNDNGLWREGDMVAAHRIQKKRGSAVEYVNVGNDIKSANTDCMKKAFNVYMDIAGDVYRSEDPTLDDNQIEQLVTLAKRVDKNEEISQMIEDSTINSGNYDASFAKLERLNKQNG